MKRNIVIVVVLVVGALAVAALVLWIWRAVNAGETGARPPPASNDLREEIRSLGEEIEKLERRVEAPRPLVPARGGPSPAEPAEPGEMPEAPSRPVRTPEESSNAAAVALDERLSSEPVDADWAPDAALGIKESIAASAIGSKVRTAECGSTVCRVTVEHDTAEAQRDLGRSLARQAPFRAGTLYKYSDPGAPPVTTLYVLRDGETFRDAPADP